VNASVAWPESLSLAFVSDANGTLYVADRMNPRIRKVTKEGVVTTLDPSGRIFATNQGNARIRKIE